MATETFPPTGVGVRAARHFVVDCLAGSARPPEQQPLGGEALEDIALVVSELAANAALHAGTPFDVSVDRGRALVRIEVADGSQLLPAAKHHGPSAPTGRGLKIVEQLSQAWGADATSEGKVVWVEIALQDTEVELAR